MKELKFKRRFSKSFGNKAAVITVPRAIAQAWEEHTTVELVFNGIFLVITPCDENKQPNGDDEA